MVPRDRERDVVPGVHVLKKWVWFHMLKVDSDTLKIFLGVKSIELEPRRLCCRALQYQTSGSSHRQTDPSSNILLVQCCLFTHIFELTIQWTHNVNSCTSIFSLEFDDYPLCLCFTSDKETFISHARRYALSIVLFSDTQHNTLQILQTTLVH